MTDGKFVVSQLSDSSRRRFTVHSMALGSVQEDKKKPKVIFDADPKNV